MALLKGKVKGDKEVIRALNKMPKIFIMHLSNWLQDERANVVGGKDSKGRPKRGYREILTNRPLKKGRKSRGDRKWSPQVAALFQGIVPFARTINDLHLKMGVISKTKHQMVRAMEMLQTGGTATSSKFMPVPMIKNLQDRFGDIAWSRGTSQSGMKSRIFRRAANKGMVGIKRGGRILFFDKESRKLRGKGFKKSGLLFIGMKTIRISRQFTGRYDFLKRFDRMQGSMITRGQRRVDKATKQVERIK